MPEAINTSGTLVDNTTLIDERHTVTFTILGKDYKSTFDRLGINFDIEDDEVMNLMKTVIEEQQRQTDPNFIIDIRDFGVRKSTVSENIMIYPKSEAG